MNRVAPIVGLASHLGRGVQRIATDTVIGRVRSLPRTIRDLDRQALSQIMGRTVTSVALIGGDTGTSSRARLALSGEVESSQRRDMICKVIAEQFPELHIQCDIGVTRVHEPDDVEEV